MEPLKGSYKFVHDRVHEAAYSMIPEVSRAPAHLRIGRLLLAQTPPERRQENIFEIVNQLNRGVALITQQKERELLAELNLIAGRRAKASTAYASACTYLRTGMSVLSGDAWTHRYQLAFGLWLERAECEYLSGNYDAAERLIPDLLAKAGAHRADRTRMAACISGSVMSGRSIRCSIGRPARPLHTFSYSTSTSSRSGCGGMSMPKRRKHSKALSIALAFSDFTTCRSTLIR